LSAEAQAGRGGATLEKGDGNKHMNRRVDSKTRVFVVDDHPIVRLGFQLLLNSEQDMKICGEAECARVAFRKILELNPDLAIVDLALNGSNGLELIRQLHSQAPKLKLLVFSVSNEGLYAERALRAGAHGYLTKQEGIREALKAIRTIMQGRTYISDAMTTKMVDRLTNGDTFGKAGTDSLSDRELEVLEMIGSGLGSRAIAEQLFISIKTVESHREHIKTKLGLSRAPELVRYAFNWVRNRESLAVA
jgi:DNA-binding NarL/FixJ family response regulator